MKTELLVASYNESASRTVLVTTFRGANSHRKLSSDTASLANPDVTSNFPFLFDSQEGGQFTIIVDIDLDFVAYGVEQLHFMLHSYAGTEFYSSIWSELVPVNPTTGVPTNSSLTAKHLEFPIFLKPNSGFALAIGHDHFKSVVFTVQSLSVRVYKSYPDQPTIPESDISESKVREMLSDVMTKSEFVNSDGSVGVRSDVDFNSLSRLPQAFKPEEHNHDADYVTRKESSVTQQEVNDKLARLQGISHSHVNLDVLHQFSEKGGQLHYRGKRFDDWFLYALAGGADGSKTGWAECSLNWNTLVDSTNDFNVDLKDHGRLLYVDYLHGLAVKEARNIQVYLEFCYYDPSETSPALRYKLTNQAIHPLIYMIDDFHLRIVARDHGRQPDGTTNNAYNTGKQLLPCYRVTTSRLLNLSGQRPIYQFLGCLRQLP